MVQVDRAFVRAALPRRDPEGHKGTFGKVHILAGSVGFTGAPALASAAAVRPGRDWFSSGLRRRSGRCWR